MDIRTHTVHTYILGVPSPAIKVIGHHAQFTGKQLCQHESLVPANQEGTAVLHQCRWWYQEYTPKRVLCIHGKDSDDQASAKQGCWSLCGLDCTR